MDHASAMAQRAKGASRPGPWKGAWMAWCMALFLLGAAPAHAQKVLMLTTAETAADAVSSLNNLESEFANAGATVTRLDGVLSAPGGVSSTTFTAAPGPYDVVLLETVYGVVDPGNWTAIQNAAQSRSANSFVMFVDGCCNTAQNMGGMLTMVNAASGFNLTLGALQSAFADFPLNTGSSYASFFTGLPSIRGGYTTYLSNMPADNALYLPPGAPIPPAGTRTDAYGMLLPARQSFGGAGACLFAVNDSTQFDSGSSTYAANQGKIGRAFLAAAGAGGACGVPASIAKAFSSPRVALGGQVTLNISISNTGGSAISDLRVVDNLPAPLQVAGAATSTCTGGTLSAPVGGSSIQLSNSTLPSAGCTITVPVSWPAGAATQCSAAASVTNTITPGPASNGGQFSTAAGQVNTPATAVVSCDNTPVAARPVPTLGGWALAAMGLVLAAFGGSAWRRQPRRRSV